MLKKVNYLLTTALIFCLSCVNGRTQTSDGDYKAVAEEKLSGNIEHVFSPDSSYVLSFVEIKGNPKQPQNSISFIIHDLSANEVVYEGAIDNGSVKFHSDHELKIVRIPGMMREDQSLEDFTQIYDLRSKE